MNTPFDTITDCKIKKTLQEVAKAGVIPVMHTYADGGVIVQNGTYTGDEKELAYASVPLGVVLGGGITIAYEGKEPKKLGAGDFLGVFEFADVLQNKTQGQVGTWSLIAQGKVTIAFFPKEILQSSKESVQALQGFIMQLAIADTVPKTVTSLPLLDAVAASANVHRLKNTAIMIHTHILPSMIPLIKHFARLVGPSRVYVVGKQYSTVQSAHNELARVGVHIVPVHLVHGVTYSFAVHNAVSTLWHTVLETRKRDDFTRLLILDDGGEIWSTVPWNSLGDLQIAGTEQTQRGITRTQKTSLRLPPIVSVATSGIKKYIETPFITRAVIESLIGIIADSNKKVGIIGFGALGQALFDELLAENRECHYYDIDKGISDDGRIHTLDELLSYADIIIGTTGTDALRGVAFENVSGHKVFASASSADIEFEVLTHFKEEQMGEVFDDFKIKVHNDFTGTVLNGGYPVNFNREHEIEPKEVMMLTRALLYIGLLQANLILDTNHNASGFFNLDAKAQKDILQKWFKTSLEYTKEFHLEEECEYINESVREDFHNFVF